MWALLGSGSGSGFSGVVWGCESAERFKGVGSGGGVLERELRRGWWEGKLQMERRENGVASQVDRRE